MKINYMLRFCCLVASLPLTTSGLGAGPVLDDSRHLFLSWQGQIAIEINQWDGTPASRVPVPINAQLNFEYQLRRLNSDWEPTFVIFRVEAFYKSTVNKAAPEDQKVNVYTSLTRSDYDIKRATYED